MENAIGRTIKVLRTALGLKQGELARQLGISANYLSMIESGKREPTLKLLRSIGTAMKVPASILFVESVETPKAAPGGGQTTFDDIKRLILETQRIILENRGTKENG